MRFIISRVLFSVTFVLLSFCLTGQTSAIGTWKTVDDNTGEERSYVEIYEREGLLYGKISKLLTEPEDTLCESCKGDKKNKPLVGMEILWELESTDDHWSGGKIMDPENGKSYKCKIYLESENHLRVRGYIGIEVLGRNQNWYRVEE